MVDKCRCAGLCVSVKYGLVIILSGSSVMRRVKLDLYSLRDGSFIRNVQTTPSDHSVSYLALCICPGEASVLVGCRASHSYVVEVDITNTAIDPTIRFIGREDELAKLVGMDCNADVVVVADCFTSARFRRGFFSGINVFLWTDGTLITRFMGGHGMFPRAVRMLRNARQFMVADGYNHRLCVFDNFSGELVKTRVCVDNMDPTDVIEMPDRDSLLVGFSLTTSDLFEVVRGSDQSRQMIAIPQFRNWHHLASVPDIGMVVVAKQPHSHDIITLIGVTSSLRRAWLCCCVVSCK